jgi:CARDB
MTSVLSVIHTRKWRRLLAIGAFVLAAGCADQSVDAEHIVSDRFVSFPLTQIETRRVVSCTQGSVLLGVGYRVHGVNSGFDAPVSIRSSRPVGDDSWELTAERASFTPPGAVSVSLNIYCLRRPDGQPIGLSSQAVEGSLTALQFSPLSGVAVGSATADCPLRTQTLTAGGFAVILSGPDVGPGHGFTHSGEYNSWIDASLPEADRTSWRVHASYIRFASPPFPRIRAYALCVNDPDGVLQAVQASDVDVARESDLAPLYDVFKGSAPCGVNNFSAGGGFEFHTEPLVPHFLLENRSGASIASWQGSAVVGAQVANEPSPLMTVRPLCFAGVEKEPVIAPDLFPLIGADPLASQGCPNGANPCLNFTVVNDGTVASAATDADVFIFGATPVRVAVPSLEPGSSVPLAGHYNAADLCTVSCTLVVMVDPDDVVDESRELNNRASHTVVP